MKPTVADPSAGCDACDKLHCKLPRNHEGECLVEADLYQYDINQLVGKLKTLMDASISNTTQCKALKDLVRETVWMWVNNQFGRYVNVVRRDANNYPLPPLNAPAVNRNIPMEPEAD